MFDRDHVLKRWRDTLIASGNVSNEQADELCTHLLDTTAAFDGDRLSEEEKFLLAAHRIGRPVDLAGEYEKETPWRTWRAPIHWAAAGVAWTLGIEAVLDNAIPAGALAVTRWGLASSWMQVWAVVVLVGGPLIAFGSVGAWMRKYSASHPASTRALLATTGIAALLRLASSPIAHALNETAWRGFDRAAFRSFQQTAHVAELAGLAITMCVAALALVRFRSRESPARK